LSIELVNYTRNLTLATNNETFEDSYIKALRSLADSKKMLVAHFFAKVDEEINATFNQDGSLIEKIAVGDLTLVNEELASTGWTVKVVPEESTLLAYFEDIMPGKAKGKPLKLKELPALTVSTYGNGSGILFASDIGTSAKENLSREEWLNITSRAIDWIFIVGERK
jgi:hypothetical protein